ncbi:MAG: class I SAM-dependent methyltransferase [Endomicrobiales bacterium]
MFDFGQNWKHYSSTVLDTGKLEQAKESLSALLGGDAFTDRTVLDIGCGTGIFSIGAALSGARDVLGIDINPTCVAVSEKNAAAFARGGTLPRFMTASILDDAATARLGTFDIVYAWGSLHHTGNMRGAIEAAAGKVKKGGKLVLAIYNRHFTSPFWKLIKWSYNLSPLPVKKLMYYALVPVIFAARAAATRENPLKKERGMDFFVDTVDWIGGYPYEYASPGEIVRLLEGFGFSAEKVVPGKTPIACNEFVFARRTA